MFFFHTRDSRFTANQSTLITTVVFRCVVSRGTEAHRNGVLQEVFSGPLEQHFPLMQSDAARSTTYSSIPIGPAIMLRKRQGAMASLDRPFGSLFSKETVMTREGNNWRQVQIKTRVKTFPRTKHKIRNIATRKAQRGGRGGCCDRADGVGLDETLKLIQMLSGAPISIAQHTHTPRLPYYFCNNKPVTLPRKRSNTLSTASALSARTEGGTG